MASPALELYREERAKIAKIQRGQLERQLVRRDEVRQSLGRIATILRGAGDALQRSFGPEAVEILYEALEDAEARLNSRSVVTRKGFLLINLSHQRLRLSQTARNDVRWFLSQARPRRLRSMRAFAEEEIIIPEGPHAGRRFRCSRQPYTGLWFDAVDSGRWSRCVATGPTQSGKTLSCFVIPLIYHLFELGETVICGLPDMDMASDKWREDILPVMERSKFRESVAKARWRQPRRASGIHAVRQRRHSQVHVGWRQR